MLQCQFLLPVTKEAHVWLILKTTTELCHCVCFYKTMWILFFSCCGFWTWLPKFIQFICRPSNQWCSPSLPLSTSTSLSSSSSLSSSPPQAKQLFLNTGTTLSSINMFWVSRRPRVVNRWTYQVLQKGRTCKVEEKLQMRAFSKIMRHRWQIWKRNTMTRTLLLWQRTWTGSVSPISSTACRSYLVHYRWLILIHQI